MMYKFNTPLFRFMIVGGMNTLNYYMLYLFFLHLIRIPYMGSHILAFLISMVGSFFLNTYFTYKTRPSFRKFFQFPLTYVVNISVTTAAVYLLVDVLHMDKNISPLLASLVAIPFTFVLSKWILLPKQDESRT